MKRVRSTLHALPLRSIALATCFATASGLAWAQDKDAATEQLLEGIQNGERVEISLPDPEKQLPLEDLRKFTEVFSRIKDAYVEEVSDRKLLESAIKGMLSDLDPHSTYLAPKDYEELEESKRAFLYMPFMHSESADIHEIALYLFDCPGLEDNYNFELRHKAIIDRFGRYPHRNDLLGRESTPEEIEFLQQPGSSF